MSYFLPQTFIPTSIFSNITAAYSLALLMIKLPQLVLSGKYKVQIGSPEIQQTVPHENGYVKNFIEHLNI